MARTRRRVWLETSLGLMLLALVAAYFYWPGPRNEPGGPSVAAGRGGSGPTAYFTQPSFATPGLDDPELLAVLVKSIDRSERSIDAALYDLDLPEVRDALLRAHRRGLQVRMVAEGSNREQSAFQSLALAGVPLIADERGSLMHHKFLILDQSIVWTGSTNLTWNGVYRNDNHMLRFDSPLMAHNYAVEFEEMFSEQRFGPLSRADTPYPALELDDRTRVHVYFSPDDGAVRPILERLRAARRTIEILAFSLTSDPIAEELQAAAARGVSVRGVVEASRAERLGSDVIPLRETGLDLRLDGNPANLHHKVIVVDGEVVISGSYNFSRSAEENNDENLVIVYSKDLARAFQDEFDRLFAMALP